LLKYLEKFIYKNSDVILGQSQETLNHIKNFVDKPFFLYRNLPKIPEVNQELEKEQKTGVKLIVYAGLLGFAQGILEICKNVDFENIRCEFHIYGRGMQEEDIKNFISNSDKPIYFHGAFLKSEANTILSKYDAALVPLATHIKGAMPSKIYELIQLEVPILFSGKGDGATLIIEEEIGLVSKPGDWKSINSMLDSFSKMSEQEINKWINNQRSLHRDRFNYNTQFEKLNTFLKKHC
jgi:glycosyltransferase involved in cell wall biosynthesis